MSNPDIFSYLDYREFCRDFYDHGKQTDDEFSYRSFARKAEVAPAYLKHVIDGKRNLSPETSQRFGKGMGLSEKEIEYFENLVRFNQAENLDEKTYYFERLRKRRAKTLENLNLADAAALLSDWYVVAIKELVVKLNSVRTDLIQKVLRRKISEAVIHRTIENLVELEWLVLFDGVWKSKASQVCFPDEVKSYVVRSFHRQMLELGQEALDDDLEEREFGATVFSFPSSKIPEMKTKIKEMQKDFISYVQATSRQEGHKLKAGENMGQRIFFLGVQCFALDKKEIQS